MASDGRPTSLKDVALTGRSITVPGAAAGTGEVAATGVQAPLLTLRSRMKPASFDAVSVQVRSICVAPALATARFVGALGSCISETVIVLDSDTPAEPTAATL